MGKVFYQFLCGVNFILYLLCIFLWLSLTSHLTLNICTSIFTFCMTMILILKRRRQVETYLHSTQFKYLTQYSIHGILVLCILGLLNYLIYKNPLQWDITANQSNRLNQQSIDLLKKIESPVLFKIYARRENARNLLPLLELYRLENTHIKVQLLDPEVNPLQVHEDKIHNYGQVVVEFKERSARFLEYSEKAITNALLRILRQGKTTIYFSSGHRSSSLADQGPQGLSKLKGYLESEGHVVEEVALSQLQRVQRDSVLALWGPRDGLLAQEQEALKNFLQRKGRLLLALDPQIPSKGRGTLDPFAALRNLIAERRLVTIANDFVVDSVLALKDSGGAVPVVEHFDSRHPVTEQMVGQVFFPLVSSIQFLDTSHATGSLGDKMTSFRLAQTSDFPASWAERDFSEVKAQKVSFTQGRDLMGPITVMGAIEGEGSKTLVVGNSSFVHNQYFDFQNNFLLFSNAVNWLLDQGGFISFSRPKQNSEKLVVSALGLDILFYFSVILLPLLLLALAFLFYRMRVRL